MSLSLLFVGLLFCQAQTEKNKPHSIRDQLPPALVDQLQTLEADYGLTIVLDHTGITNHLPSGSIIQGNPPTVSALLVNIPIFIREWRRYPPTFIKRIPVNRIYFCHYLNIAFSGDYIGGVADTSKGDIYYGLWMGDSDLMSLYKQILSHHELFHLIDHRISKDYLNDKPWRKLNNSSFVYEKQIDFGEGTATDVNPGFITLYAKSNTAEDKAETFSHMMTNLHEMECRGQDDLILGKKIDRIKYILKEFSPEMDERYWSQMRRVVGPRLTPVGNEDNWALAHPILPLDLQPVMFAEYCRMDVPARLRFLRCLRRH